MFNSSANATNDDLRAVQEIFAKLGAIYGAWTWESFIGKEFENVVVAKHEWWKELKKYSDEEIGYALAVCRKKLTPDGQAYPPKLPEFIGFCDYHRKRKIDRTKFCVALPRPPVDILKAESAIENLRAILKKPKKICMI